MPTPAEQPVKTELSRAEVGRRSFDTIERIVNNSPLRPEADVPVRQYFFRRIGLSEPSFREMEFRIGEYLYWFRYSGTTAEKADDDSAKAGMYGEHATSGNFVSLQVHKTNLRSGLIIANVGLDSIFDEDGEVKKFKWGYAYVGDEKGNCPPDSEETFERIALAIPELLVQPTRRLISL